MEIYAYVDDNKNLAFFHSDADKFIFVLSIIDVESSFRAHLAETLRKEKNDTYKDI